MKYGKVFALAAVLTSFQLITIFLASSNTIEYALPIMLSLASVNFLCFYLLFERNAKEDKVFSVKFDNHSVDPTLQIAHETLPFLRRGLNEETARQTADIILKISNVDAVAITDKERVLAYVGAGCERHQIGRLILTQATKEVINTGELKIVENKQKLNCPVKDCDCRLEAAVIAPLTCKGELVGCVKLYQTKHGKIPPQTITLAVGIAQLLGVQMELAELEHQAQLVTKAELQALHAQINPHFLFNTLNTIIMFSRTNPETARKLLIRLATFFRQTLKKHGHFNTFKEELEYINTYLVLEKARFREKIKIIREIDKEVLDYMVPVLTLQPLVENAIKHGITPKIEQGTVEIRARKQADQIFVTIKDDGVGIPKDQLQRIFEYGYGSNNGVGLSNVHERLKSLFGEEYGLHIESTEGEGTTMNFRVPLMKKDCEGGDNLDEAESVNS